MNRLFLTKASASVAAASAFTLVVACANHDLPLSTFDLDASDSCLNPVESLPATVPSGTLLRVISFHVTNDSGQTRWVQTSADEGCSTFDLVRGGAPFVVVPPAPCGCECKAPEPRTGYTRLAPGESVDVQWDGLVYVLAGTCVTGAAFGCPQGTNREVLTASASAALATRYDGVVHVESVEPPGCTAQAGSAVLTCGAEGALPDRCAHGVGETRFSFVLGNDPAPMSFPVSLK